MVYRQELLVVAFVLIVVGAIIWGVPWPAPALKATDIVGQVLFWIGIALFVLWAILLGIYYTTKKT